MTVHWKIIAAVLAIVLAGAGTWGVLFAIDELGNDDADPPAPVAATPFGVYSPGILDEVPTSAGRAMLEALDMSSLAAYQNYSLGLVKNAGASWVRMDFIFNGWNYLEPAAYLEQIHASGLEVIGCLRPINRSTPADLGMFKRETLDLVRRYPWITVWQIGNEPNLAWNDPAEYPRFFLAGREAVREACPSCRIALAGAAALYPSQTNSTEVLTVYRRILGEIIRLTPPGTRPFDIMDLHYYGYSGDESAILGSINSFRELLASYGIDQGTDLWVTETATTTGQPTWPIGSPMQTEGQQAADLVERFTTMLGAGVTRVSWARPYENYRYADNPGNFYNHTGLVYNGIGQEAAAGIKPGTKKMAYYAYQTMTSETSGATQVQRLAPGQYKFSFSSGRRPVYVLWSATGGAVPDGLSGPVTVTSLNGTRTLADAAGVTTGPMPVFVETR